MIEEIRLPELLKQTADLFLVQGDAQTAEFISILLGSIAYAQQKTIEQVKEEYRTYAGETLAAYTLNALTRLELQGLDVPYSKFVKRNEIDDVMIRNEIDN